MCSEEAHQKHLGLIDTPIRFIRGGGRGGLPPPNQGFILSGPKVSLRGLQSSALESCGLQSAGLHRPGLQRTGFQSCGLHRSKSLSLSVCLSLTLSLSLSLSPSLSLLLSLLLSLSHLRNASLEARSLFRYAEAHLAVGRSGHAAEAPAPRANARSNARSGQARAQHGGVGCCSARVDGPTPQFNSRSRPGGGGANSS